MFFCLSCEVAKKSSFSSFECRALTNPSLHSWWDLVCECFCFGGEAVSASGEAVRGLVKSRVDLQLRCS